MLLPPGYYSGLNATVSSSDKKIVHNPQKNPGSQQNLSTSSLGHAQLLYQTSK